MKTITLQLYTFDELSEEVQKEIIERERWNIMDQCMEAYGSDYVTSLRTCLLYTSPSPRDRG